MSTATTFLPDVRAIGGTWDLHPIAHHRGEAVAEGRAVLQLDNIRWPFLPEGCLAGPHHTTWLLDGSILVCTGCGLDLS